MRGDSVRDRPLSMGKYGLSKWEYKETAAYCRQYPDMLRRSRIGSQTDQLEAQAELAPILTAAAETRAGRELDGEWQRALIATCCEGLSPEKLDGTAKPTSNRNAYYEARREFFWRVWAHRKGKI